MAAITYFIAALVCPVCGRTSPEDHTTQLVTRMLSRPGEKRVGTRDVELRWPLVAARYPVLREPEEDEPVRFMETWTCPYCASTNWARITFADRTVTAIEAVPLDLETVSGTHAISPDVGEMYWTLTGGERLFPNPNVWQPDFAERLLAALRKDV